MKRAGNNISPPLRTPGSKSPVDRRGGGNMLKYKQYVVNVETPRTEWPCVSSRPVKWPLPAEPNPFHGSGGQEMNWFPPIQGAQTEFHGRAWT